MATAAAAACGLVLGSCLVLRWRDICRALCARLAQLVTDSATNEWSPSKLWYNLGNLVMSFGFLKVVWTSQISEGLSFFFMVYGGLVAGSQIANRVLGQRANGAAAAAAAEKAPEVAK